MVQGKEKVKKVLVILVTGAEQMEVFLAVEVMRRAKMELTLVGLPSADPLTCSRDVVIKPDCSLSSEADSTCAAVLVPGGAKVFWWRYRNCSENDRSLSTGNC